MIKFYLKYALKFAIVSFILVILTKLFNFNEKDLLLMINTICILIYCEVAYHE